jgi:16S rRNA (guanine527-N7)-methyltransferase
MLAQLHEYCELVLTWNRSFNFISRKDIGRLLPRHILDSLSALPYVRGERVLDVGSGAGLPGIPLAIVSPEVRFDLCDRAERRIRFLEQVCLTLGLSNVACKAADLGAPHALEARSYATITARALAKPGVVWGLVEPLLGPTGRVLCFLSTQGAEVGADINADERFRAQLIEVKVPGLAQAHEILSLERP